MMGNLIDNAIKYSPDGGRIIIAVSTPAPNMVRLAMRDQGLGIPVEQRAHIFDRFYQAHASSHRSGLGLYISPEGLDSPDSLAQDHTVRCCAFRGHALLYECILSL